jgi:hypothetical protein
MSAQNPISEKLSDQALVVYKAMHEHIAFLKKQQWTITNYLILLYAGVYAIKKEIAFGPWLKLGLRFAIAAGFLYGVFALVAIQRDLGDARVRLDNADSAIFGPTEYRALGLGTKDNPFARGLLFTFGLLLVLLVGALLVSLSLGR